MTADTAGSDAPRGVLHPQGAAGRFTLDRQPPSPALEPLVEYYWRVCWDLRDRPPYEQKVLAHPNIHLVFEEPRAAVYGVDRGLFVRRLVDQGQVLGVRFRPGGFRAFWGRPVQELADQVVPATEVFGAAVEETSRQILAEQDSVVMAGLAEAFLLARLPRTGPGATGPGATERGVTDPQAAEVAAMVATATSDHTLLRVEQLAERHGVSVRTLQRLFAEYVGAGPKWVLRRARLHEAAQRAEDAAVDWSALATDLGYADQAHLTRDFTAVVGLPPARYVQR
ncbi:AraC family transcriptional regulator [Streptacidiphilus sp. PAMC 29251]